MFAVENDSGNALHRVAACGEGRIIVILLHQEVEISGARGCDCLLLQLTARYGHPSVVSLLIYHGVGSRLDGILNSEADLAFHKAVRYEHVEVVWKSWDQGFRAGRWDGTAARYKY